MREEIKDEICQEFLRTDIAPNDAHFQKIKEEPREM